MTLNGEWKLYYYPCYKKSIETVDELLSADDIESVSASVPGNVELDLSKAGILPNDLFKGMNILEAERFETYDWWYEKKFTAPNFPKTDEKAVLHFGAVDCYADYFLNGEKIGESDNMFISHDFDVTDKLLFGKENTLYVHIKSATVSAAKFNIEPNLLAYSWHTTMPSAYARKAQHSYGWDIMPRAVSAGIWRDVSLEIKSKYEFRYLYFTTVGISGNNADIRLLFDSTLPDEYAFRKLKCVIKGRCGGNEFSHTAYVNGNSGRVIFKIENAKLWWPKHYGDANVYDVSVELSDLNDNIIISGNDRFGIRTLKLKHSETVEKDGGFEFIINGKRIMTVGTNWVPMDAYHSRDKARYKKALDMADDLGCNIIRCWGGNVYEEKEFFDYCDDHGLMVWQDFGMGCKYYPQNDTFIKLLEKEAEWVVSNFRNHPCLVLWCGDNENDSMLTMSNNTDPVINRLTREVLPRICERFDPYRPYIASSPYISTKAFNSGDNQQGSKVYPEDHLWGPRDYFKSDFYSGSGAYFVSETGYHGCPAKKSIEKFIDKDFVWPYENNKQWNLHSSDQNNSSGRTMLMHKQVKQLFGTVPENIDDFVIASQISQAEAKKFFIEHMRAQMARNGGIIWWNLVDGWPQMSDAVVDYYYEKKLAYNYIKRSQQGFMIMVDELNNWGQNVLCCNSTLNTVAGKCKVYDIDTNEVFVDTEFTAGANCNTVISKIPIMYSDKRMLVIEWETGGKKYFNTYLCGTPAFDLEKYKSWLKKIEVLGK